MRLRQVGAFVATAMMLATAVPRAGALSPPGCSMNALWVSSSDGQWGDAGNWQNNLLPCDWANADIPFPNITVTVAGPVRFHSVSSKAKLVIQSTMIGDGGFLAGDDVTLLGDLRVSCGCSAGIQIDGALHFEAGNLGVASDTRSITLGALDMTFDGIRQMSGDVIVEHGGTLWSKGSLWATGSLQLGSGTAGPPEIFTIQDPFKMWSGDLVPDSPSGGPLGFVPIDSEIDKIGTGPSELDGLWVIDGMLDVQDGTLTMNVGVNGANTMDTRAGEIRVEDPAGLRLTSPASPTALGVPVPLLGPIAGGGSLDIAQGEFELDRQFSLTGPVVVDGGGATLIGNTTNQITISDLTLGGHIFGRYTGSDPLDVTGSFNAGGGASFLDCATVSLDGGSTLAADSPDATLAISNCSVFNHGTMLWQSDGTVSIGNDGALTNLGSFDMTDSVVHYLAGGGAGTSHFSNFGTLDVRGSLLANLHFEQFDAPAGATIASLTTLHTGASVSMGSSPICATGTWVVHGGDVSGSGFVNGNLDVEGGTVVPGTIGVVGDYTQGGGARLLSIVTDPTHYGTIGAVTDACHDGGHATLAGTLVIGGAGAAPDPSDLLTVVSTAQGLTGTFGTLSWPMSWGPPTPVIDATHYSVRFGTLPSQVVSVAVAPATLLVGVGSAGSLDATATFDDASQADVSLTVTWSSADPTIATVDSSGNVDGVHVGVTIVSATLAGHSGSALVVVGPAGTIASSSATGMAPAATAAAPGGSPSVHIATTVGTGTIIASVYGSDPVGNLAGPNGTYWDVWVEPGAFPVANVTLCPLSSSDRLMWWNPAANAWQPVSAFQFGAPSGCQGYQFSASSTPTIAQLAGTVLGATPQSSTTPTPTPTCTRGPIVFPQVTASPNPAHPGDTVTLDGSGSFARVGAILSYAWTQILGPSVQLAGANSTRATFVAPVVDVPTTLTFEILVHGSPGGPCDIPDASTRINLTVLPSCTGDCDGSGDVTVNELITMVNIALGNAPLSACSAGDADGSGEITINEIIAAVNQALTGCG